MRLALVFVLLVPGGCFFNAPDSDGTGLELDGARIVQAENLDSESVLVVTTLSNDEQQRFNLFDLGVIDAGSNPPRNEVTAIAASSTGKLAIAFLSGQLAVLSTADFRLLSRENAGVRTLSIAWSGDGTELAVVRARTGGITLDIRDESLAELRTIELDSDSVPSDAEPRAWYSSWSPDGVRFALSWSTDSTLADGTCVVFDVNTGEATALPISRAFFVDNDVRYANDEQVVSEHSGGGQTYGPLRVSRVTLRGSGPVYEPVPGGRYVKGSDPSRGLAVVAVDNARLVLSATPFTTLRIYDAAGAYSREYGTLTRAGFGVFSFSTPTALLP